MVQRPGSEMCIRDRFTRDFTLLALGQALSLAGNYALRFALSMYVLELTGSAGVFAGMLALDVYKRQGGRCDIRIRG